MAKTRNRGRAKAHAIGLIISVPIILFFLIISFFILVPQLLIVSFLILQLISFRLFS